MNNTVVVLGASPKEDRYSYKAVKKLKEKNFVPLPIHPLAKEIDGVPVVSSLEKVDVSVDTVSLYVNPKILEKSIEAIINLQPRRVIFNPGTESDSAEAKFKEAGIETLNACTLVLLTTNQF